jgi:hypothetical protein
MRKIVKMILSVSALFMVFSTADAQQLKKSITWENIRNHPAPLPVIGELVPVESNMNAASVWSVGTETLDRDYGDFNQYRQYLKETGVGYARLQSGWAKTEQVKGVYDFSWIDPHVDGLLEEGIHPWMCLCYGNPIYSDHGHDLDAKIFSDGPIMDGWLNYVRACVSRYKDKVTMWEVWNEPDGGKNGDSYNLYAHLFVRTAQVIKEVDPDAKVASFGIISPDKEYIRLSLKQIAKEDGIKYMDYLTFHAYWPAPELIIPAVQRLKKDVEAYSPSIRLLQGETGAPGQLEYGHGMKEIEWCEYSQAKWDLRQSLNHFGMGIPYSFFTMVDLHYGWMLQSFGLIRMNGNKEPVYKRPKFYAVQHVTSLFTSDMKATDDVKVSVDYNLNIRSYGLEKNGKKVGFALWIGGERPTASLERKMVDVNVTGLKMEDPVYVDMLTGYVHELKGMFNGTKGGRVWVNDLPVWDSPVVIIERSEVNFRQN